MLTDNSFGPVASLVYNVKAEKIWWKRTNSNPWPVFGMKTIGQCQRGRQQLWKHDLPFKVLVSATVENDAVHHPPLRCWRKPWSRKLCKRMEWRKTIHDDRTRQNRQIKNCEKAHSSKRFKKEKIGSWTEYQTTQYNGTNDTASKGKRPRFHPFKVPMRNLDENESKTRREQIQGVRTKASGIITERANMLDMRVQTQVSRFDIHDSWCSSTW